MGRDLCELRAALQIPFLRDVSADEPPLCLYVGLAPRARALLSARRHPCGAGLVPERRACRRALQAVRAELTGIAPALHRTRPRAPCFSAPWGCACAACQRRSTPAGCEARETLDRETARVHHAARQRGGGVAGWGARAAE